MIQTMNDRKTKIKEHIRLDLSILVVLILGAVVYPRLPDLIANSLGKMNPVVTQIEVLSVEEYNSTSSKISAKADKLRDLNYIGIECYLGKRGGAFVSFYMPEQDCHFTDPPRVNGKGEIVWDGLIVGVPPEQLPYVFIDARHAWFSLNGEPLIEIVSPYYTGLNARKEN